MRLVQFQPNEEVYVRRSSSNKKFDQERAALLNNFYFLNKHMSKEHAKIEYRNNSFFITDLSTFGTIINDQVLVTNTKHPLKNQDRLGFILSIPSAQIRAKMKEFKDQTSFSIAAFDRAKIALEFVVHILNENILKLVSKDNQYHLIQVQDKAIKETKDPKWLVMLYDTQKPKLNLSGGDEIDEIGVEEKGEIEGNGNNGDGDGAGDGAEAGAERDADGSLEDTTFHKYTEDDISPYCVEKTVEYEDGVSYRSSPAFSFFDDDQVDTKECNVEVGQPNPIKSIECNLIGLSPTNSAKDVETLKLYSDSFENGSESTKGAHDRNKIIHETQAQIDEKDSSEEPPSECQYEVDNVYNKHSQIVVVNDSWDHTEDEKNKKDKNEGSDESTGNHTGNYKIKFSDMEKIDKEDYDEDKIDDEDDDDEDD